MNLLPVDHPLDDCRLKVDRAKEQFDALHGLVVEFFEANPCEIACEVDAQTGQQTFKVPEPPELPRRWGLLVGEACHNARSALDQMIYALARKGGGDPERDRTAFPIYKSRDDYWRVSGKGKRALSNRDRYLAGVEEDWRRKVDDLQPYHRRKNAHLNPLAILADITNRDKHQLLHAGHVLVETPAYNAFVAGTSRSGAIEIAYNLTTPVQPNVSVTAEYKGGHSTAGFGVVMLPKSKVDDTLGINVIFGEPPCIFTLYDIKRAIAWVGSILKWFEPAFDPEVVAQ